MACRAAAAAALAVSLAPPLLAATPRRADVVAPAGPYSSVTVKSGLLELTHFSASLLLLL